MQVGRTPVQPARRSGSGAMGRPALSLSLISLRAAAAGPAAGIRGTWTNTPAFTPSCTGGFFENTPQLPSRNFACDPQLAGKSGSANPPRFVHPQTPISELPPYTKDPRRDHHHVVDGPVIGNGNVGVAIGAGNLWNVSHPWIDLFISTNSFWALSSAGHTVGKPFRGRLALPGTMLLGVARLSLPDAFAGKFHAEQDLDSATVRVNFTSTAGATVQASLFVSPLAPLLHTTLESDSEQGIEVTTTVLDHFWHRDNNINVTFPVATTATCPQGGSGASAAVTRASDFADSGLAVTGAIHHTLLAPAGAAAVAASTGCSVAGKTSASLAFTLQPKTPTTIRTAVRVSRDPSCVARADGQTPPLCGLGTDAATAAAKILADAAGVTLAEAQANHAEHWQRFWNTSTISLPQAPETERFWYGSMYILNSAIPHEGQEQTPPGLYGPWGTRDNPGWHGDYTIDYNYEAIFYGVMSSNHPELMIPYPQPMLDFMPSAHKYAAAKSQLALNITCGGLHFPDVLAPWGVAEGADGVNADAGLNSNGPFSTMPCVWEWEFGDRSNLSRVREKLWPLVKGEADFFSCWLQKNETTGYYHDLHDCTSESAGVCQGQDSTMTLSMSRRSFDIVSEMAAAIGEPVDPQWEIVRQSIAPYPSGWMHLSGVPGNTMTNTSAPHMCSFCGPFRYDVPGSVGDCQATNGRVVQADNCTMSIAGRCPAGTQPCNSHVVGDSARGGHSGVPSGGNSHSIFPAFPADGVGTNDSQWTIPLANTVFKASATSFSQGNAWTKIYSAAARLTAPGLLKAEDTYKQWLLNLKSQQQPNFIPFNPFSGFETVGASEFVNYMLLQSDPSGFLGLFEAWPHSMDASFERLRGRGAFVVSSSFTAAEGGHVGVTTLVSERGTECVMRRPSSWPRSSVKVVASDGGGAVVVAWRDGSAFFSFATTAGTRYTLSGGRNQRTP